MGFDLLLGNGALKSRLGAALAQEKTGHCYLLAGPAGSGKTTLARLLAAALQCEGREKPCGICGTACTASASLAGSGRRFRKPFISSPTTCALSAALPPLPQIYTSLSLS